jgi:hypothetical protein
MSNGSLNKIAGDADGSARSGFGQRGAKARQKAFQVPVLWQPLRKNASHFNDFVNLAGDGDEPRQRAYRAFHEYFVSDA